MPNIEGLTIKEANKILQESGLEIELGAEEQIDTENTIVKTQTPNAKVMVNTKSKIYITY